jgi:outer membrane receptor protein involved in Fe transport
MNVQNSIHARVFRHSLMALACAAAAAPAFAQTAATPAAAASAPDTETPQRVEVTGSRIKQIDAETASPVQVISREDIKKAGATSVREMLDSLTVTRNAATPPPSTTSTGPARSRRAHRRQPCATWARRAPSCC